MEEAIKHSFKNQWKIQLEYGIPQTTTKCFWQVIQSLYKVVTRLIILHDIPVLYVKK